MKLDEGFLEDVGAAGDGFVPPHPHRPERGFTPRQAVGVLRRNILAAYRDCDFESRIVRNRVLRRTIWVFNAPDHIREALHLQHEAFQRKSPQMRRALEPLLGDGLFVSDRATWRLRRSIVAPIVHGSRMAHFAPVMCEVAGDWRAQWRRAEPARPVNMLGEMGELTAEIISRTIFGRALGRDFTHEIVSGFADYQRRIDQIDLPWLIGLPDRFPRFNGIGVRRALKRVHRVIDDVIDRFAAARAEGQQDRDAVIGSLFDATDAAGRPLTREAIRNEAIVIFMAGHETTANTLAWAFYLISQSPRIRARLSIELDTVLGGRIPALGDVPRLTLTRAIIEETLRLYPPVPILLREALGPGTVGGRQILPGHLLMVAPWLLHRNRDVWSWPDMFLPERFEAALAPRPSKHAYIPFATGPRICPGLTFGLTEAVICLATLAQEFDPAPVPGHEVEVECRLTLRPGSALPMLLNPRRAAVAA